MRVTSNGSALFFRNLPTFTRSVQSKSSRFLPNLRRQEGMYPQIGTQNRIGNSQIYFFQPPRRFCSGSQTSTSNTGSMTKGLAILASVTALAKVFFDYKTPSEEMKESMESSPLSGYEETKDKDIPHSLLATLKLLPHNYQATLIMRHGERLDLPSSGPDNVLLTEHGKEVAKSLGALLSTKKPGLLVTSPKGRCVETLTALVQGSSWVTPAFRQDKLIAPSNPFITDLDKAIQSFAKLGGPVLFNKQITDATPPEGMGSTANGVKKVLNAYVQKDNQKPHLLNIVVTHDAVLTVVVGYLCDLTFSDDDWPEFLNGVLLWRDPQGLNIVWRGEHKILGSKELKSKGIF